MKKKLSNDKSARPKLSMRRVVAIFKKPLALFLILALAAADVFTMLQLFGKLNTDPVSKWVYSLTFATCLEGIPTFMGICLSKLLDRTNYKKNDVISAAIGMAISTVGILIAFWMAVDLRSSLIESYGGAEAFANGTYAANSTTSYQPELNSTYLKDRFLLLSPIITSVLAFVTSWITFPSDNHSKLENELDELHMQFIDLQSEFQIARNTTELAQASLWKDLADSDTNMPRSINAFRKECFVRIRNLLYHDCMKKYPKEIQRYNEEIESELMRVIQDMAKHTTIRDEISALDLQQLLQDRDTHVKNPINSWDYNTATVPLQDDLKQLLNNAIVVAQFKSTTSPRYKEGNKW